MNNQTFNDLVKFGAIKNQKNGTYSLPLSLNKNSSLFIGHFPNQPILPGVIMVEITKRGVQIAKGKKLVLVSAGNFKFLKMIDPSVITNALLLFEVIKKDDTWRVKAKIKAGEETYFKADANYKFQ